MEEKEVEETKENTIIRNLLNNIKSWFVDNRKIERIKVVTATQSFWVSNPKKIKFWRKLSEQQAARLLMDKKNTSLPIRITKVIYE